jgi:heme-degrading monooxygenase HmoA
MVVRIWHGWTSPENADAYERLLEQEVFMGIESREIRGYEGIELLRRDIDSEVEFVTVMRFASYDAVRAFAGEDWEAAVIPPRAKQLLSHYDERSQHYSLRVASEG